MWASPTSEAVAWDDALEAENGTYHSSVAAAAFNAICAARRFNELFVGGDDTPYLVQLLCAPQDSGEGNNADVLASVLLPADEVQIAFTARGAQAVRLVASFWAKHPKSPALLHSGGGYHQLMCQLPAGGWTQGILCPAHIRALQASDAANARFEETLLVYVPGEPNTSQEEQRAAVQRCSDVPHACPLSEVHSV